MLSAGDFTMRKSRYSDSEIMAIILILASHYMDR